MSFFHYEDWFRCFWVVPFLFTMSAIAQENLPAHYHASQATHRTPLYDWIPAKDPPSVRIAARFDGRELLCRLDTGSNTEIVPYSEQFSKYQPKDRIKSLGINCSIQVHDVIEPKVECAGLDITGTGTDRMPKENGLNADALIGLPIYQGQKIIFDFGLERLLFGIEPTKEPRYPLIRNAVGFLEIPIEFNGNTAVAVWDTGCQGTVITRDYFEKNKDCFTPHGQTEMTDINYNEKQIQNYQCSKIQIGHYTFFDKKVVVSDGLKCMENTASESKRDFANPDVFLGLDLILDCDWYFDTVKQEWALWVDQGDRLKIWQTRRDTFPLMSRQEGVLVDPMCFVDDPTAQQLKTLLAQYGKDLGAEVRIVIVPSEGNWEVEQYSWALANSWKSAGRSEEWFYLVYSIAGNDYGVSIRDEKNKFAVGFTQEKLMTIMGKVLGQVRSGQLTSQRALLELIKEIRSGLHPSSKNAT